jgi:hypothetical protein
MMAACASPGSSWASGLELQRQDVQAPTHQRPMHMLPRVRLMAVRGLDLSNDVPTASMGARGMNLLASVGGWPQVRPSPGNMTGNLLNVLEQLDWSDMQLIENWDGFPVTQWTYLKDSALRHGIYAMDLSSRFGVAASNLRDGPIFKIRRCGIPPSSLDSRPHTGRESLRPCCPESCRQDSRMNSRGLAAWIGRSERAGWQRCCR